LQGYPEGHPNAITEVNSMEQLSEAERRRCSSTVGEDGAVRYFVCRDDDYARELAYLKKKVDAGAECIFTQMFFDAEVRACVRRVGNFVAWHTGPSVARLRRTPRVCVQVFLDFVRACREVGIQVPILPGILCVNSVAGFRRMVTLCKTRVPEKLWKQLEAVDADNEDAVQAFAVQLGVDLCSRLLKAGVGVPGLHFYTLNLEPVTTGIVEALGLGPFSDEQGARNLDTFDKTQ
jgi:methylenetetrahydrofolate reductase (NADPH)